MKKRRILSALMSGILLVSAMAAMPASAAGFSRVAVHDPSIVKKPDGSYFIIGSHLGAASSADLMSWTSAANSAAGTTKTTFFSNIYTELAVPEKWSNTSSGYDLSGNLWAPDIVWNPKLNKWCMYLSVNGEYWHSSIVLCTADNIEGPYSYVAPIVYSGFETSPDNSANLYTNTDVTKVLGNNPDLSRYLTNGKWNADYGTNAIDPCTFYDENGELWMIYGSWFGGIYMLALDENTGLRDYNVTYSTQVNVSDAYMGKKIAGGHYASGEGPYIEYMKDASGKGYYYLFLSYGYFNSNGGYNMRIFRSEKPDGPYYDQNGNSPIFTKGTDNIGGTVGERLMSNYQWSCNDRPNKAQGHNSALMDSDGRLYVIYHNKFDDAYGFHEVRVHQMFINADGWPVAAPYEYSGETVSISGYSMTSMAGDYEFIFHTLNQAFVNDQSADVEQPKNITLNTDGTVSGDITGTWAVTNGTPYMSLTYGGVTYKGNFIAQCDESAARTEKMCFTATGSNTCVWGSKKTAYEPADDGIDITRSSSQLVYNAESAGGTGTDLYVSGTSLLSGLSYFITSKSSGLTLDLAAGSTADGTAIQQWALTGGRHQEWRIISEANGYCRIASLADESKVIAIEKNSADNGLFTQIETFTGADNQLFKLKEKDGWYGIVSKCSGDAAGLDVYDWSTQNGGKIDQWEYWEGDCQLWSIVPVYPAAVSGSYTVRNLNSGLFIASSGSDVLQSAAETWQFTRLENGSWTVRAADGRAWTVAGGADEDGADISLAAYTGDTAQQFRLRANADGTFALLTAASEGKRCADVYGISLEDGANICQWEYWGGAGQRFILEPAQPLAPAQVIGDVNADGSCDMADAVALLKYLLTEVTTLPDAAAADLNSDGKLTAADLTLLKRVLLAG